MSTATQNDANAEIQEFKARMAQRVSIKSLMEFGMCDFVPSMEAKGIVCRSRQGYIR
jgi:hypothetical protein